VRARVLEPQHNTIAKIKSVQLRDKQELDDVEEFKYLVTVEPRTVGEREVGTKTVTNRIGLAGSTFGMLERSSSH